MILIFKYTNIAPVNSAHKDRNSQPFTHIQNHVLYHGGLQSPGVGGM